VDGGTIMSYCHLTPAGINFSHGFGPLPGNLIRSRTDQANCLSAACPVPALCPAPGSLSISNITGSSATCTWTAAAGASAYMMQWRVVGQSAWTNVSNVLSPYILSGLPAGQQIEIRLQSICSANNTSGYLQGVLFKTLSGNSANCDAPATFNASAGTANQMLLSWSAASGGNLYQLSWKPQAASTWGPAVTTSNLQYTLNGLQTGISYQARILTLCGQSSSDYSYVTFTTTQQNSSCSAPSNIQATQIQPNSARLSWNPVFGAQSYDLQIRFANSNLWQTFTGLTSTNVRLLNLKAQRSYQIRLRGRCSNGSMSDYTPVYTFSTPALLQNVSDQGADDRQAHTQTPVEWQVFPNPAEAVFTLQTDTPIQEHQYLFIFNLLGQMQLQREIPAGVQSIQIDVRELPAGSYWLRLPQNNVTRPLIKI
jgi:hypothetical protein